MHLAFLNSNVRLYKISYLVLIHLFLTCFKLHLYCMCNNDFYVISLKLEYRWTKVAKLDLDFCTKKATFPLQMLTHMATFSFSL